MQMNTFEQQGITVLALVGRLDATTAHNFEERCRELLAQGVQHMVVDLEGVAYMSSAGLRSILTMQKAELCHFVFCAPQPMVVDIFRISGFNRILTICANRTEALEHTVA